MPLLGLVAIGVEKARLAVEHVGVAGERDDALRVVAIEAGVDDVRDALAGVLRHQVAPQRAGVDLPGAGGIRYGDDLVVAVGPDRGLQSREPGSRLPAARVVARRSGRSGGAAR